MTKQLNVSNPVYTESWAHYRADSKEIDRPKWIIKWTIKGTSQGKTTVGWEIRKTGGGSKSPTWYTTQAQIEVTSGQILTHKSGDFNFINQTVTLGTFYAPDDKRSNFQGNSFDGGYSHGSGEFEITHNSSGKASFSLSFSVAIYTSTLHEETFTIELPDNMPYEKANKPTNVSIYPKYPAPGQKSKVTWSAPSNIDKSPIKKYEVYYKIGNATAQCTTVASSSTSAEITLGGTRGNTVEIWVKACSNVKTDYDSQSVTISTNINRLPTISAIKKQNSSGAEVDGSLTLPSTGGTVKLYIEGSVGSGEAQPLTYYYKQEGWPKEKEVSNPVTFTPDFSKNTSLKYYFYVGDGVEKSETTTITTIIIQKNTKPTLNSITIGGPQYSDNEKIIATVSNSSSGKNYTYSFGITHNGENFTVRSASSDNFCTFDVRKLLSKIYSSKPDKALSSNTTYTYQYWAIVNDGIEDSERKASADQSYTTPIVTLKNDNDITSYFSRNIKIYLSGTQHGSYTKAAIGSYSNSRFTSGSEVDVSRLGYGTKVDLVNFNDGIKIIPSNSLTRIYEFVPQISLLTPSIFQLYTSDTLKIAFRAPEEKDRYGFSADSSPLSVHVANDLNNKCEGTQDLASSDSTYIYTFQGTDLYALLSSKNAGPVNLKLQVKNEFGDTFSTSFYLSLQKTLPLIKISATNYPGLYSTIGSFTVPLNDWQYLIPNMQINVKWQFYSMFLVSSADVKLYFQTKISEKESEWSVLGNTSNWSASYSGNSVGVEGINTKPNYKVTITTTSSLLTPNPSSDGYIRFKIMLKNDASEAEYIYNSDENEGWIDLKRQAPPQGYFTEASYNERTLTVAYKIDSLGCTSSLNPRIDFKGLYKQGSSTLVGVTSTSTGKGSFSSFSFGAGKDYLYITPRFDSTLTTTTESTYSGKKLSCENTVEGSQDDKSIYYLIYNISPTVAYRKNQIGINSTTLESDNILTVSTYDTKHKIQFKGIESGAERKIILDINTGEISGLIINCGTWDTHTHDYSHSVTKPTCTEQGYTTHTCSICNDSYTDTYKDPNGHTSGTPVQIDGYEVTRCTVCDEVIERKKIDTSTTECSHNPGEAAPENRVESTCTQNGSYDLVTRCTKCDEVINSYAVPIPASGHSYDKDGNCTKCDEVCDHTHGTTITQETISGEAYEVTRCAICKKVIESKKIDSSTTECSHDLIPYHLDIPATCTEHGYTGTWYCQKCHAYFSDSKGKNKITDINAWRDEGGGGYIRPLGHDYIHHEAQRVTCTKIGWDAYDTCSRCDYTTYVEIPALRHDYNGDGICTRCGLEESLPSFHDTELIQGTQQSSSYIENNSPDHFYINGIRNGKVNTYLKLGFVSSSETNAKITFKEVENLHNGTLKWRNATTKQQGEITLEPFSSKRVDISVIVPVCSGENLIYFWSEDAVFDFYIGESKVENIISIN